MNKASLNEKFAMIHDRWRPKIVAEMNGQELKLAKFQSVFPWHHLSPVGVAGFIIANGSMSTQSSGEGEIRKVIIQADLMDCMVALPGQLFFTTQTAVCPWFLARDKKNHQHRDSRG